MSERHYVEDRLTHGVECGMMGYVVAAGRRVGRLVDVSMSPGCHQVKARPHSATTHQRGD